jgi:hypothetical protein
MPFEGIIGNKGEFFYSNLDFFSLGWQQWVTENPPVERDIRISKLKGSLLRRQAF